MVPVSYADVLKKEAYIHMYNNYKDESTTKKRTLFNSTPNPLKNKKKNDKQPKKKTNEKKNKKK